MMMMGQRRERREGGGWLECLPPPAGQQARCLPHPKARAAAAAVSCVLWMGCGCWGEVEAQGIVSSA